MPELPEVEAARRAVAENCVGKKIVKAIVADDSKVIDGVSPKDFEAALVGKTILAAHRKGKNMWIELDSPPFPSFQFGMAGAVYIKGVAVTKYKRSAVKDTDEWPSKYSKLFVELDDGLEFSFTDKRRFAKVRLLDNPVSVPPISELGPDALTEPMTEDEFLNSLRKKNIGIKALLLDQSFISGIGNWMADEVLYQARIHPMITASSLSRESCATLLKCINEVSERALEVGADSSQFPTNWIFHSREKKPGKAFVDGKKLDFIKAGGRTTAYVPDVQKLTGNQAIKELGKKSQRSTSGKGGSVDESGSEDEPPEPKVVKGRKTSSARKASTVKKSKASVDESGSEDEPPEPKVVKGRKTSNVRKASTVKKSEASVEHSDEDDDDDDGDEPPSKKRKGGAKKPPAKSKLKGEKNGESQRRQTRGRGASSKKEIEESDDDLSNGAEEEA